MENQLPVRKNEKYILDIVDQGHEGQGVGKLNDFTVFVEGALTGEKVEVKVLKVTPSHAFGKLERVLRASPERNQPFCSVFARCGGCHLQHMSYPAQLEFKTRRVREAVRRIGGLEGVQIKDAIEMDSPLNYRNKAQYPVGLQGGQAVIGFYAGRTHEIISGSGCAVQHQTGLKLAEIIRDFIKEKGIPPYDEKTGKGIIRHIVTRIGFATGESMAVIIGNAAKLPHEAALVEYVRQRMPEITGIVYNINRKNTNVIMGDKNIVLFGRGYITDRIGELKFKISPNSFFQVNPVQTQVLYEKILEYAQLSGDEVVFDLYCGTGSISLYTASKAGKVLGIENVEAAVRDAKENAELNGAVNAEFICGDAEKVVPEMYAEGILADVVIVDPPRKGCDRRLLETIGEMKPERIVYVSCNPATLARDLGILNSMGYEVKEIQPVDMFPHTYHVECVVRLQKK